MVGSGEGWLTELDARSFRDLVSLSREALLDGEATDPEPKEAATTGKSPVRKPPARPGRRSA